MWFYRGHNDDDFGTTTTTKMNSHKYIVAYRRKLNSIHTTWERWESQDASRSWTSNHPRSKINTEWKGKNKRIKHHGELKERENLRFPSCTQHSQHQQRWRYGDQRTRMQSKEEESERRSCLSSSLWSWSWNYDYVQLYYTIIRCCVRISLSSTKRTAKRNIFTSKNREKKLVQLFHTRTHISRFCWVQRSFLSRTAENLKSLLAISIAIHLNIYNERS